MVEIRIVVTFEEYIKSNSEGARDDLQGAGTAIFIDLDGTHMDVVTLWKFFKSCP